MTNNNLLPTKLMHYQEKVMRISKMITLKRNALIIYQILSTNSLTKFMEISLENLYLKIILSFKGPPLHQERGQKHGKPGQGQACQESVAWKRLVSLVKPRVLR